MGRISKSVGDFTINQVDYQSRGSGKDDVVCQVKKFGVEVCHCTWHPDGAIHCKDKNDCNFNYADCPFYGKNDCLR